MKKQKQSDTPITIQPSPSRSRWAVSTIFFINGMVLASWIPHIPAIKMQHAIGDGQLGLVLLSMAGGSILTLPLAGWLVSRFGSRLMTALAAISFCLMLPLPISSPNIAFLCLSLGLLGACNSTLDVSMNAQAVAVEQGYQRAIMSSFHGLFSLGGLVGAMGAGLVMSLGMDSLQHVLLITSVSLLSVLLVLRQLFPTQSQQQQTTPTFVKPTGALLGLGALALLGLVAEGAMGDWSAVYLTHTLHTSSSVAAIGFAAFSGAMAIGRFSGDSLVNRFGPSRLLRASSTVAAAGLGFGLFVGEPVLVILGFGLVGLGIANIIPVLFSAAGQVHGVPPGMALAAVASTGYLGFLAGPPLIGFVAEITNLSVGLGLVSAFCALIALSAKAALQPLHPHSPQIGLEAAAE